MLALQRMSTASRAVLSILFLGAVAAIDTCAAAAMAVTGTGAGGETGRVSTRSVEMVKTLPVCKKYSESV